ncbi:MAG: molybdopterin biosynthesis protein, partial [Candidatus Kariarchaeaceae archaeon]
EEVPLLDALNRILADDIFSPIDVPPFDRAAMDGFAVKSNNTTGSQEDHSLTLKVIGSVKAGHVFNEILGEGESVEISTGAPLPIGADSVVMVEYADRKADSVDIYKAVSPGENTMSAGADIQLGERILTSLSILTSRELAVLAAMGYDKAKVIRKPRIGVFSSGDEIVELGNVLEQGKLFDINSTAIASNILENGGDPHLLGIIPDDIDELRSRLSEALPEYDMIIISGGTSAGMGDILYTIVDELGSPGLLVHGVKVKPGKPTILAVCDGTPIIGLPGYPASALSIYKLFVLPYILKIGGQAPISAGEKMTALVRQRIRSVSGRHEFKPVYLIKTQSEWLAFPVPGGSGAITSIALADGFIEIPENTSFIPPNAKVEVSLLSERIQIYDIQIIGSHCLALAQLQKLYTEVYPHYHSRSVSIGSSGGVAAVRRHEAHIAGIHLFDEERGYNEWLADDIDGIIVSGYYRMQGFIVQEGNPKEIYTIFDLLKEGIRFMNRNPGSGTRVLFDVLLKKAQINPNQIPGYTIFGKSHTSIAAAVKSGAVDVSIGIESAAQNGLEFIPLREEEFDFLIPQEYVNLKSVQDFIKLIHSNQFHAIIEQLPGYRMKDIKE